LRYASQSLNKEEIASLQVKIGKQKVFLWAEYQKLWFLMNPFVFEG